MKVHRHGAGAAIAFSVLYSMVCYFAFNATILIIRTEARTAASAAVAGSPPTSNSTACIHESVLQAFDYECLEIVDGNTSVKINGRDSTNLYGLRLSRQERMIIMVQRNVERTFKEERVQVAQTIVRRGKGSSPFIEFKVCTAAETRNSSSTTAGPTENKPILLGEIGRAHV